MPASWELVEALIALSYDEDMPFLGLVLALGFNCMLRTSEMIQLTGKHLLVHPNRDALSVVLPTSKTSVGNPQVLQVSDSGIVAMAIPLLEALSAKRRAKLLWRSGAHCFRQTFQRLLRRLGFAADSYLPYSLRRGGATWYYQTTLSLDATVTRGRWACVKTARQYTDEGTMQLAHVTWSSDQCRAVNRWRKKGVRLRQRRR